MVLYSTKPQEIGEEKRGTEKEREPNSRDVCNSGPIKYVRIPIKYLTVGILSETIKAVGDWSEVSEGGPLTVLECEGLLAECHLLCFSIGLAFMCHWKDA
jgi:hypothetical protein